jgi:hypothetical protein
MAEFRGKKFEIPITRSVDANGIEWPSAEERRSEILGGNRDFAKLGRATWSEVLEFIDAERDVVATIAQAEDWEACYEAWSENCWEEPFLFGFDLGTNALSAALAAARCLPFYSCNGGAFEDGHNDTYPLVAFFCRASIFPFIEEAARKVDAGLEYNHSGGLTAFGSDLDTLINMAAALYDLRTEINAVCVLLRNKASSVSKQQASLFEES